MTLVLDYGVEGDYHAGANVRHRSRAAANPDEPNLRQVHLMHAELFDELALLGIRVEPGNMGENITTRGLALLTSRRARSPPGDSAGSRSPARNPCAQLDAVTSVAGAGGAEGLRRQHHPQFRSWRSSSKAASPPRRRHPRRSAIRRLRRNGCSRCRLRTGTTPFEDAILTS